MTEPPAATAPSVAPAPPSGAMMRTLALVAMISGLLIVSAYQGTLDAVNANKRIALERAVRKVIPSAVIVDEYYAGAAGIVSASATANPPTDGGVKFYAAYDGTGKFQGIAAEAAATGYADLVRILYGYDPGCQCIVGIAVVSMRETPGIGDKILSDPGFLKNFEALDVRLGAKLKALANAVRTVKHGTKQHPWEIDAISGATVTSNAVGRGIHESAQALLPRLVPKVAELQTRKSP
jgi:Na+-translocating ferredoxin:NAD+ oxidoreductase subunit G